MGTPGRRQLQKIQIGEETQAQGTPAAYFSRMRVAGGMLNDNRSINMVDEMLGYIPGQTRSYVTSADGQIALGGTPMSPQQLPIHTGNAITGITYGTLSVAAQQAAGNAAAGGTLSASTNSFTITTGTSTSHNAGDIIYDNTYKYVGTIKTSATNTTSFTLVNYVNIPVNTATNGASYYVLSASNALTSAFTYDINPLPFDSFPTNNVSYTIQAGDDFEQETTTYAKCMGFSTSGSSGGTLDLSASYMTQAVRLATDAVGTITASTNSATVTGVGTNFQVSDVGRKLYTTDYKLIGTIGGLPAVANPTPTQVVLTANALVAVTNASFYIGGFSVTTIPTPIEDLIFARTRLYIDDVAPFPVANPTPVVASFLAFSAQLQCSWVPKFTGEGYQGIDPTWSFALMTNYALAGDFTIEHNETASGKYSVNPVESLKYAWRNRVPKIIQIDCPGSTILNWHTVSSSVISQTLAYTLPTTVDAGTITINPSNLLAVTGVGTSFTNGDVGKALCVKVGSVYKFVGIIATYVSATSITLTQNVYGAIYSSLPIKLDATKATAGGAAFTAGTDNGKDVFSTATTWVGRIAVATSTTVVHFYQSPSATLSGVTSFFVESVSTQPYFPVPGQGPLKTYTGLSYRIPVQILNVSGLNDQSGNDIVTVQWQQRYNETAGSAGDIRIVNQIAVMPTHG